MYTLNVSNDSTSDGTFVIFQKPTEADLRALAWKTINLQPRHSESFSWEIDYGFICGECETLAPGNIFKSELSVPAEASTKNEITCNPIQGKCNFEDLRPGKEDVFTIVEVDDIPMNKLALGISVDGSPLFVAQAQPTTQLEIPEVDKQYYVSFGKFQEGEVLDARKLMVGAALVDFRDGASMAVTYLEGEMWSVKRG